MRIGLYLYLYSTFIVYGVDRWSNEIEVETSMAGSVYHVAFGT